MLLGTGIDIVDITRIEAVINVYNERFIKRILNDQEYQDMIANIKPEKTASFVAKRFAIKEAVVKAIGCGIGKHMGFHDLTVIKDKLGIPMIKKTAVITEVVRKIHHVPSCDIHISVSDERKYVVAIANLCTGKEHNIVSI